MTRTGKFRVSNANMEFICTRDTRISEPTSPQQKSNQQKITLLKGFEYTLLLLNRLLIGFVTIYLCWMCLRLDKDVIPWHAVLSTVGFLCLMSEGLMAHYRGNAWTQICERPEKTRTHWILQLCGSIIGIAGIVVKILPEDVHFHTAHGQLGLAALVLLGFSLFSGLSSLYANELRERVQPLLNKACHNVLGLLTYLLAMLSMYTSFDTDVFLEHSLDGAHYMDFRILLKISITIIMLLSSYGPIWCLIYSKLWKCC